jgi:thiol:disulfide interchange protein DsbD
LGEQLATSSGAGAFAFLFVGGLLASLLPCVYPLYPITVTILRARKSSLGSFAHPLAYYGGLAAIYLGFGIIAALTGGAFNAILRLPIVNIAIGAMLFLLALATVQLLIFPSLHSANENHDEGLFGTCMMGMGAGLLSSACVGPVVVSILVALAANAGAISVGTASLAAFKMLTFGLGVGFPIVLIGIVGLTLPRGGRWMVAVQWGFAILIAYFALGYLLKGFAAYGLKDDVVHAVIIGAGLLLASVFFLQDEALLPHARMKRALLVVAGVTGALVMARNILPTTAAASASAQATSPEIETKGNLTWFLDKDAAYLAAAKAGKPVFLDFHGDWCTNCKAFQERVAISPELNAALQKAVLLKVYDGSALFRSYTADPRFPELKVGLPFFIVTDPNGNVIYKTSDFTRTDEMILVLSG